VNSPVPPKPDSDDKHRHHHAAYAAEATGLLLMAALLLILIIIGYCSTFRGARANVADLRNRPSWILPKMERERWS